jgi:hypothetical protein
MNNNIIKVYPAKFFHDNVVIIGNTEGLKKLQEMISAIIKYEEEKNPVLAEDFTETDGKVYKIIVKKFDNDVIDEKWLDIPLHYEEDMELSNEDKIFLAQFLVNDLYKKEDEK